MTIEGSRPCRGIYSALVPAKECFRYVSRTQLGDFVTGLWVMEGSTSDPLRLVDQPVTTSASNVLAAVPFLRWELPASEPDALTDVLARVQAAALQAVRADEGLWPLTSEPNTEMTFDLSDGGLLLRRRHPAGQATPLESVAFDVHPRTAWFLQQTATLSVQVSAAGKSYAASVTLDGGPPRTAAVTGSLAKNGPALLESALGWQAVLLANRSLYVGARSDDTSDHHFRVYGATPNQEDLPRLGYKGGCLACGARPPLSVCRRRLKTDP